MGSGANTFRAANAQRSIISNSERIKTMRDIESRIIYENGPFYAFEIGPGKIDIRKHSGTIAYSLGVAKTKEQAIRFIDRACKYPDKF